MFGGARPKIQVARSVATAFVACANDEQGYQLMMLDIHIPPSTSE
jgi:hypothetical protein